MGEWALVTGASGEIGQAIAKWLSEAGYHLYLHYFRNEEAVSKLSKELQTESIIVKADLSDKDGVNQLVQQINHDITILIHNSGDSYYGLITDMDDSLVEKMVQLHITSPFNLTKRLLPSMISRKKGKIVMITSVWGVTGASCETLYSTVKGGQNTFVKALAKEVAPSGLNVNAVAPGAVRTKMLNHFTDEDIRALEEEIPMGKLAAPMDIANAVGFLVSEQSSYINGEILSVNGAWYT